MIVLITYDVCTSEEDGAGRLRRVARICLNYGIRVQKSVFECKVTPSQRVVLEDSLRKVIDPEKDSIRIYDLGDIPANRIIHMGTCRPIDLEGTLIF
ncbi:CRISPR-associated endonuclease Cas2 [Candidatus Methanomethylophilus sp. 1R26]|uniref:CRISPR-associated endonuclease Cas2 n=1 Tax=Candidatus Methanomethylophilus sp. 1R26 TaxID=1769296 RepID=UPI0007373F61|nr:CRISPR-associated endonuclease Cas2 [Candidatus Methanomethylophilus sp. 1R26]